MPWSMIHMSRSHGLSLFGFRSSVVGPSCLSLALSIRSVCFNPRRHTYKLNSAICDDGPGRCPACMHMMGLLVIRSGTPSLPRPGLAIDEHHGSTYAPAPAAAPRAKAGLVAAENKKFSVHPLFHIPLSLVSLALHAVSLSDETSDHIHP
jgi:hypothetical protein